MMEQFDAALRDGDARKITLLVEEATRNGVDLAALKDADGRHLAHLAVEHGQMGAFVAALGPLLERNASAFLDPANRFGETPLHTAAADGNVTATRILIERGANVQKLDDYGNSALHCAAAGGNEFVVRMLVDAQAPSPKNRLGQSPAELARERGHHGAAGHLGRLPEGDAPGPAAAVTPQWMTVMQTSDPGLREGPTGSASVHSTTSTKSAASANKGGGAAPG